MRRNNNGSGGQPREAGPKRSGTASRTGARDFGLLVLRLGAGVMFIFSAYPILFAGSARWERLGQTMSVIGITDHLVRWGLAVALTELAGGVCLVLGVGFRIACAAMACVMLAETAGVFRGADDSIEGLRRIAGTHSLDMTVVLLAMLLTGAGTISLAQRLKIRLLK